MKRKIILGMITLLFIGSGAFVMLKVLATEQKETDKHGFGIFSWNEEMMSEDEAQNLSVCLERTNISTVYQQFSEEMLLSEEASAEDFIDRMKKDNVQVYGLMGQAEWAYDRDGKNLIDNMDYIATYNEKQAKDARIKGILVDVEPYLLKEWDEGWEARAQLMEGFLSGMEHAYGYALKNQLEFWVCIPTFYDSTNKDILEALISRCCDGVAVMNYNRTDEYGQMAMEIGFAREYGKGIICIYELQKPGRHSLEDINTYANEGLDALWQSSERLKRQFGYERLGFAYHYYKPLKEMLGLE